MDADAGTLIPTDKRNSLIAWFNLYMGIEAGDQDSNTFKAKQSDLSRFISYFRRVTGSDHPDQWTRSVSQGFVKELLRAKSERTGKKLAPTTVNRVLATLRNTARWIHHQRVFLAGYPMERISDVSIPEPEWRGLADVDVTRLKSAAEQLVHIHTRVDQNALRDQVILLVMLDTAFRVSELVSLDLEQYEGKHFRNVKRKGNHVTDRVFVGQASRDALDRYIREIRGNGPGSAVSVENGPKACPTEHCGRLGEDCGPGQREAVAGRSDTPHPARAPPHGPAENGREEGHPVRAADGRPRLDQIHLAVRTAVAKRDGRGRRGAVRLIPYHVLSGINLRSPARSPMHVCIGLTARGSGCGRCRP